MCVYIFIYYVYILLDSISAGVWRVYKHNLCLHTGNTRMRICVCIYIYICAFGGCSCWIGALRHSLV